MDYVPDGSNNGNPPERCPHPLYSHRDFTQEDHNYAHHDQVDRIKQPVTMDHQTPLTSPDRRPRPLYSQDPILEDHNYAHYDRVGLMEHSKHFEDLIYLKVEVKADKEHTYVRRDQSMENGERMVPGKEEEYFHVMMASQPTLTSPDGSSNGNPPERCPSPLYSHQNPTQEDHHHLGEKLIEFKKKEQRADVRCDLPSTEENGMMDTGKTEESSSGRLYFRNNSERPLLASQDEVEDSIARFSPRRNPITYNARPRPHSKNKPMDPSIPEVPSAASHSVNPEIDLRSKTTNRSTNPSIDKKSSLRRGAYKGKDSTSCLGCGKSFAMTSELLIHLRSHTKVTYTCPDCGESFTEKSELLTHLRSHTDGYFSLSDDSDDDLTLSADSNAEGGDVGLYSPGVSPRNDGINPRPYFRNGSLEPANSTQHSSGILLPLFCAANNVFPCPQCGKCFRSKHRIVRHLMDVHTEERPYVCSDCGKCYARKVHLLNHLKVHRGGRPFSCTECGKGFISAERLIEHRSAHTGEKLFFCAICGERFRKKRPLMEHERLHTGETPFQCLDCGKAFRAKRVLKLHLETHLTGQPFSCSQCGKLFKYSISLNRHKKLHERDSPLSCAKCGKSFPTKYKLQLHLRSHTGKKIFQCSECDKSFLWKADLVSHQRVHIGEKPFFCSECGKHFSTKKVLEDHMKLHSNVNPFACAVCGKSFIKQRLLQAHQIAHTGKRPFSCSDCGKSYNRKCNLIRHQKIDGH